MQALSGPFVVGRLISKMAMVTSRVIRLWLQIKCAIRQALVIAEDRQTVDAAGLVEVNYEVLDAVVDPKAATQDGNLP